MLTRAMPTKTVGYCQNQSGSRWARAENAIKKPSQDGFFIGLLHQIAKNLLQLVARKS